MELTDKPRIAPTFPPLPAAPAAAPAAGLDGKVVLPPPLNTDQLFDLYQKKRHEELAERLLRELTYLRDHSYFRPHPRVLGHINVFMKHFLHLFTQEDFTPGNRQLMRFVDLNPVISNLAAMSVFRDTDPWVRLLLRQRGNMAKILTLYSPRNRVQLEPKKLFDANAALASRWYFAFLENYKSGCIAEHSFARLRAHAEYRDERMVFSTPAMHHAYFGCTYLDHERDRGLKEQVNALWRKWPASNRRIVNKPDPRRIGVFTSMWVPTHSVYRSQQPYLEELAKDYELTLIHIGPDRPNLDGGLFKEVKHFKLFAEPRDFSAITPNDFALAYFPDIGMSVDSIFLSNLRLAPVQVTNYGHPVSTWGSEIDYFIGGADVEVPELAAQHYSERLVLIPGCGQISTRPRYEPKGTVTDAGELRIACSWTGQKINHPHLLRLRAACEGAAQPVKFVFFPGGAALANGFLPMARDIAEVLGAERVEVHPPLAYDKYMELVEGCHFAVDAYPFGGYNSAVDVLWARKPLVSLRGNRFYNTASAYLSRRMGLEDMSAGTPEAFVALLARMINDAAFREGAIARARAADTEKALLSHEHAVYFRKAIAHLLENHDKLRKDRKRAPIRIT